VFLPPECSWLLGPFRRPSFFFASVPVPRTLLLQRSLSCYPPAHFQTGTKRGNILLVLISRGSAPPPFVRISVRCALTYFSFSHHSPWTGSPWHAFVAAGWNLFPSISAGFTKHNSPCSHKSEIYPLPPSRNLSFVTSCSPGRCVRIVSLRN